MRCLQSTKFPQFALGGAGGIRRKCSPDDVALAPWGFTLNMVILKGYLKSPILKCLESSEFCSTPLRFPQPITWPRSWIIINSSLFCLYLSSLNVTHTQHKLQQNLPIFLWTGTLPECFCSVSRHKYRQILPDVNGTLSYSPSKRSVPSANNLSV